MKNRVFISLIIVILFSLGLYLLLNDKPSTFYIESFNQAIESNQLNVLKWSKSKGASEYKVIIKDSNDAILKEVMITDNEMIINDINTTSFMVDIIAYNEKGKYRKVEESKTFEWKLPIINVNQAEIAVLDKSDITDITIDILNNDDSEKYIVISKNGNDLYRFDNTVISPSIFQDLDDYLGPYEVLLCQDYENKRLILHKTYIRIIPSPITDLVINRPFNNSEVPLDDLLVNFSGGKYAERYYYSLSDDSGKTIVNNVLIESKEFLIYKSMLQANKSYTLTITGYHFLDNNVTKSISTSFKVAPANKVSKIISTKPSGEIGINRAVRLFTYTDATIYYTIDGSTPTKDSIEYKGSIFIDHDLTLKAIAIKEGMIDSDIIELEYKVVEKEPAIYLSPSTQDYNYGVSEVGYTTEMEIMNKISDYIEERLKEKNIIVYRNHPDMTLSEIVNDSSKYDIDLHLSIHSNDYDKKMYGVETWVHDYTEEKAIEIADLIQSALMKIYYNPKGNRGVKYSNPFGGMRETDPKNVTNGVLVEIGFHDHYNDAKWMVDNQKEIGYAIADAVISYLKTE